MIRATFILLVTSIFTTSYSQKAERGYEIVGLAVGFPDNTLLFLEYSLPDNRKHIDSTNIKGEKFTFKGAIPVSVVQALIRTKTFSDYKFLWLENLNLRFAGEKGKFRHAIISGSKTQDDDRKLDAAIKAVGEEKQHEVYMSFIRNNPNSIISAHLLSVYGSTWGREITSALYESLSGEMKLTHYGKNVEEFVSLNKNVKVGDKYVDFSQEDVNGNVVKLSDFDGKVVLLEFWGSWCGPCRKTNPKLVKIYNEFRGRGFEILGVGAEADKAAWLRAIQTDGLTWANVTDLKGDKNKAALIYGISYYPTNFLIDRTGTIVARDIKGEELKEKLKELCN